MVDLSSQALSVEIALTTFAVFLLGRAIAWIGSRRGGGFQFLRGVVVTFAVAIALFFYFSPSSRYALLLPAALAAGFLTFRRQRIPAAVFEPDGEKPPRRDPPSAGSISRRG